MTLPERHFDGVFANASLFHVPSEELPRVLLELSRTLKPRGVLFCSNPRGKNEEGFRDDRYSCFFDLDTWRNYVSGAGFVRCSIMACTRFQRHRVRCFNGAGGGSWRDGSLPASLSLRL
jgi:SAM-dependent methyltransferase